MANTSVTTTIRAGMNTDLNQYNLEKGQYSFALNAAVEDFSGNGFPLVQNDSSNYLAINFPESYSVIGKKFILELNTTLYLIVNPTTGVNQIGFSQPCLFVDSNDAEDYGICKDCIGKTKSEATPLEKVNQTPYCSYTTIVTSDCLGFSMDYPVDIEYRIVNNALYIYFIDALNKLRFIYFDIVNGIPVLQDKFKVITGYDSNNCDQPIYSDELDCNKILYNPNYEVTQVSNIEDVYGGSLPAGVYQVMVAYADSLSNPLTSYFAASNPYPLRTKNITIETNYNTLRALSFDIEDIDQTGIFQFYNIVIAQTVDNFTDFYLVATLPVTTKHFLYTGINEVIKKLTPSDVLFKYGIFESAGSLTKANDYLFFANLKQYRRLNLQRAVSQIKAYWQTIAIKEEDLKKPGNVSKYRGGLRDEVYPYGIVFEFTDDNDSVVYPLIGPDKTDYPFDIERTITGSDVISEDECKNQYDRNKLWQVYSTATIEGRPHQITSECDENKIWEWGKFSYWESTENYPNVPEVWGDLCGKPIRHFKFPDSTVTHMHDGLNVSTTYERSNIVYPIGIRIDHQSVKDSIAWAVNNNLITQDEADSIKGYRIVRGNRAGNKSIQAKGLLYDMWNYSKDNKTYYYPNFPYNDLTQNFLLAPDISTYDGSNTSSPHPSTFVRTDRYTFHSPDTHFTNTSLGSEIKVETEEYGKSEGYFNNCNKQPNYRILSEAARILCFAAGFAAAVSHVTKECRGIMISGKYATVGTADSVSSYLWTHSPELKYNTFGVSSPILPAQVTNYDCKGTPYNWMNPIQVVEMFPEHATGSFIMGAVLAVAGILDIGLYFFVDVLNEMSIYVKLIQSLIPSKNYFIQYNSIGRYNAYKVVSNAGNKIRKLDYATYLDSNLEYVDELVGNIIVNNRDRESSVMLRTDSSTIPFPSTTVIDNSRITMDSAGIGALNQKVDRDISSYYASIKNYVPNQYGSIYNISYLETGSNSILLDDTQSNVTIFGGDTFISRFGLKIKHPLFIQTRFNQLDNADVSYSELGNAAYPNYYLDYGEGIMEKLGTFNIGDILGNPASFFQDLVGTDDTRLDAKREKFFYQQGYVHLYNYGIPYFLVESDVNVDYRHGENDTDLDYYPHQSDLDVWLQEENVPITRDNAYIYNSTYSKQNKESVLQTIKPDTLFGDASIINDNNLIIYTEKAQTLNEGDNWKILRPDNFYRVDTSFGTIVSIDGIESDKVLIRCENGSQIFGAYDTIETSSGQAQINNSGIFQSRPKEFAVTHLGYMGSQHRDILDTEFGHIFVDAKRGNVFNLAAGASGLDELTKNGMKNWFKNNLPFFISKHYPQLTLTDLDNSFNGVGISLCFDRRFNRMFLTKLDYAPKSSNILYSPALKEFYIEDTSHIVSLEDTTHFDNKSWTISYNFATQMWSSFHSFTPNYYIDYIDYFQSGINGSQSTVWSHGLSNKSYQVYYGDIRPFIIDIPTPFTGQNNVLNSVSYVNDVIRYQNEYDYFFNNYITFNKAVVYNNNQNSGQLLLTVSNPNDLRHNLPKITADGREVFVSSPEGTWNINEFFDTTKSTYNNIPLWNYDKANVNKNLNLSAFNYYKADVNQSVMRGRMFNLRLINDIHSNYKFLFILQSFNSTESIK